MNYDEAVTNFWQEIGESKKMVLSTSAKDIVSSRMMSVVAIDRCFYFQTDTESRKYAQLAENHHAALCCDNIQVEGTVRELGHPTENPAFCAAYQKSFPGSFQRYTNLQAERLFCFEPSFIERWLYFNGEPCIEKIDIVSKTYTLVQLYQMQEF
jgi:hypothetical protein